MGLIQNEKDVWCVPHEEEVMENEDGDLS
jgi:hypothetical protein